MFLKQIVCYAQFCTVISSVMYFSIVRRIVKWKCYVMLLEKRGHQEIQNIITVKSNMNCLPAVGIYGCTNSQIFDKADNMFASPTRER